MQTNLVDIIPIAGYFFMTWHNTEYRNWKVLLDRYIIDESTTPMRSVLSFQLSTVSTSYVFIIDEIFSFLFGISKREWCFASIARLNWSFTDPQEWMNNDLSWDCMMKIYFYEGYVIKLSVL